MSAEWKEPLVNALRNANGPSLPSDTLARQEAGRGAAEAWLAMMRPRLVRLAQQFVANAEDAEETAQETLTLAWKQWGEMKDPARRNAWAYRATINLCMNFRRKRRASGELTDLAGATDIGRGAEQVELAERIRLVMADLPEAQQAALVLREVEGLDYHAIAAILDVTSSAVRVMVHRARESVRQKLLARWPESFG